MGRPSLYTVELGAVVCERLMEGESLRTICTSEEMPGRTTIFKWIATNPDFANQYAIARQVQAQVLADEIFNIADDGTNDWTTRTIGDEEVEVPNHDHINRSRLRVDTRKWFLSKVLPKVYGDKLDLNHSGAIELSLADRIKQARARKS